eukprot:7953149-Pyramimonas_sp.AAC.1
MPVFWRALVCLGEPNHGTTAYTGFHPGAALRLIVRIDKHVSHSIDTHACNSIAKTLNNHADKLRSSWTP